MIALRDAGSLPPSGCAGKPSSIVMTPVGTGYFDVATPTGYRLVGPQSQPFQAQAYDCAGVPAKASYKFKVGSGLTLSAVAGPRFTLAASKPFLGAAALEISAVGGGRSLTRIETIEASPAAYMTTFSSGVVVCDWYGDPLPQLPRQPLRTSRTS